MNTNRSRGIFHHVVFDEPSSAPTDQPVAPTPAFRLPRRIATPSNGYPASPMRNRTPINKENRVRPIAAPRPFNPVVKTEVLDSMFTEPNLASQVQIRPWKKEKDIKAEVASPSPASISSNPRRQYPPPAPARLDVESPIRIPSPETLEALMDPCLMEWAFDDDMLDRLLWLTVGEVKYCRLDIVEL
ncbi:hypothetical protein CYLTODRAFT_449536 [Cylindrobasidium torrendii FP15055 ss-10]|uniref:Uncharacterized protein n=1 Tax=Cylindrobasidium torrendii FP15055 ss-10 TaxID=1314674 RepID=A0A0D7BRE4_9AGAR|nr:hypothetical protein CYLTODRAFT_449536 [Cylindrobasidium torrendii FP15055 ss-10]